MMREVLFITPTTSTNVLKECVGPLLLSTILREKGVDTEILPFHRFGDPFRFAEFFEAAVTMILEKQPKILSFYTRCDCYHIMLKLAERVKKEWNCYVVFGGPQGDITAVDTLKEFPYVDFVCCGEGETTVYPLFSSLLRGTPDLTVQGLVYRDGEQIIANPKPELIADLDSLPMPDYSIFPADMQFDNSICFPIDVGRGCPFGCTYCSTKNFWGRKYRLKSPARIVEEVKFYHERFGVSYFSFQHDMFTMNRTQVMETCRLLRELDFKVRWNCSARIDCLDEELIRTMAASGLNWIYLGIETGSPRMQKLVNKNLKLETVLPLLEFILSQKVRAVGSFIYGFPEETEADVSQTLALMVELLKLKNVRVQSHLCAFLPKTALGEQYRDQLTRSERISDQVGTIGYAECAELIHAYPNVFMQFLEYKTELRTKLAHFAVFMMVFEKLRLVYLYFAQQYAKENLIQMYYDFAEDNREILEDDSLWDDEKIDRIMENDRFAKRFSGLPCTDLVQEIYEMDSLRRAVSRGTLPTVTEVFSHSPFALQECTCLEDCPRAWSIVSFQKDKDGRLQTSVRKMGLS